MSSVMRPVPAPPRPRPSSKDIGERCPPARPIRVRGLRPLRPLLAANGRVWSAGAPCRVAFAEPILAVMSDGSDEGGRRNPLDYGKGVVTGVGSGADRILDEAQRHVFRVLWLFLPEPEIARNLRFQHLLASRFFSDAGQQAVLFGALVAVARGGGSALEVAAVGAASRRPKRFAATSEVPPPQNGSQTNPSLGQSDSMK